MKKISILIPEGEVVVSSIIPVIEIFNGVNEYLKQKNQTNEDFFELSSVGLNKKTEKYNGFITFRADKLVHEVEAPDLIIVTTINGDIDTALEQNKEFIPWIVEQREKYHCDIASLCVGAFLLAETGLLDGKSASTHWNSTDLFKTKYPKIDLIAESVITEDDGIYTSGGAFSILNLILYLVEKYAGRETSIWCSKMFEIEFDRVNQNQFVIFNGQKKHDDELIKEAQSFIESNYTEKISVDSIANSLAMSRRNFIRRFKKATMNTPIEYIQRVKIEAAKKFFESENENIYEVMYSVGYSDPKAFRDIFRKYTGLSPFDYKKRYNRLALN